MLKRVVNRLLHAKTVSRPFKPFVNLSFLMERLLVKKNETVFNGANRTEKQTETVWTRKKPRRGWNEKQWSHLNFFVAVVVFCFWRKLLRQKIFWGVVARKWFRLSKQFLTRKWYFCKQPEIESRGGGGADERLMAFRPGRGWNLGYNQTRTWLETNFADEKMIVLRQKRRNLWRFHQRNRINLWLLFLNKRYFLSLVFDDESHLSTNFSFGHFSFDLNFRPES